MKKYNVADLFAKAFGIRQPLYILPEDKKNAPFLKYKGLEALPDHYSEDAPQSWMGTPIIFPATFMGGSYKRYKATGELERVTRADFMLPPATLFTFRRAKNITETPISGGGGTVKEMYGFDDWVIDVRGIALDEPTRSATEQIDELLKWEELADCINVSGRLFEQRKISRVSMYTWDDNVPQGSPGAQPFQFQLKSDQDLMLIL